MRKTILQKDYLEFKKKYEKLSGLAIPIDYLQSSDVYIFKRKSKIIGGFIMSNKNPYRTLQVFSSPLHHQTKFKSIKPNMLTEVCCFWIERKYRKRPIYNALFWTMMAIKISMQKQKYVLYGTNSRGLAKMYGLPKKSILIHQDKVEGKQTYIFVAKRREIALGVFEIIRSKLSGRIRSIEIKTNLKRKSNYIYEISN